ncbi:MAG: Acetylornithine/acetyl-lysine aminotransferase [Syntrophus sp. PtaB.Bin075]|nr:MAG: Acetylornithine/acetyl-lysine aminotransferase [Syntrophus sp. PtaB.Bin075]
MTTKRTIEMEDRHMPAFFKKIPVSIERGEGVTVWDEEGNRFLDFTAGWGVTCLGHAHPVITRALLEQSGKILQGPMAGATYSPERARLLSLLVSILPPNLTRIFFSNSGAESNDAAIKLARKVTGRPDIASALQGFHGRMTSTAATLIRATRPEQPTALTPGNRFVPYGDIAALDAALDDQVAAVLLEPIQSEGGVRIPPDSYLGEVSRLCRANGSLLIIDEVTTGFCRTGPMFAIDPLKIDVDFLTMAKGIAGGFPFGAFALSEEVAARLEHGDHGGTYCGNPVGCAVAHAVIACLIGSNISANVKEMGVLALKQMEKWRQTWPDAVVDVRGRGLLLAVEFRDEGIASRINGDCFSRGLLIRQTLGSIIRIFPALNIRREEMEGGLAILEKAIGNAVTAS